MEWLKNRTVQRFTAFGFIGGLLFRITGLWLTFNKEHLPLKWWSFLYIHRTEPVVFILDFAPIVLGVMGGLLGSQYSLFATIARGKKEWEAIFDSFSDLIIITDVQGRVLRCNHAVVDRLNTTFVKVIGKPLAQLRGFDELGDLKDLQNTEKEFYWFRRLYEVKTFPMGVEGRQEQNLFILHDVTERRHMEAKLEQSEAMFRGLFDLSPDAFVVLDPHAPNWA
jgi:PAS domain-containing protein